MPINEMRKPRLLDNLLLSCSTGSQTQESSSRLPCRLPLHCHGKTSFSFSGGFSRSNPGSRVCYTSALPLSYILTHLVPFEAAFSYFKWWSVQVPSNSSLCRAFSLCAGDLRRPCLFVSALKLTFQPCPRAPTCRLQFCHLSDK